MLKIIDLQTSYILNKSLRILQIKYFRIVMNKFSLLLMLTGFLFACNSDTNYKADNVKVKTEINIVPVKIQSCLNIDSALDVEGHRGCRGLYPENTIAGFIKALDLGVNTLEMDVVITKDKKVILSHEPWMSSEFCLQPNGDSISTKEEMKFNIYKMTYEEVSKFDCGSKIHPRFLQQEKIKETKPLLRSVIIKVAEYCIANNFPFPDLNIEIKSLPETDNVFHPSVNEYANLVLEELKKMRVLKNVIIQSFDKRALQAVKRLNPEIRISLLCEEDISLDKSLAGLGFMPNIYSCEYKSVNKEMVSRAKELKIKLVPWTVNDSTEMKKLIDLGVDGIITDYPNLLCK